jgi:hypothetical protein
MLLTVTEPCPAGQVVQLSPAVDVVPLGQAEHVRDPGTAVCPAKQLRHPVDDGIWLAKHVEHCPPVDVVVCPVGQSIQLVPFVEYWPIGQDVHVEDPKLLILLLAHF